ncbi:MAG: Gfo/Idh/MocA family oxidoreductase [Armatimonadota bacterium]|nr:Gfo/Idh/MocA family oxidoreductase [Armatimonadota bacterium]
MRAPVRVGLLSFAHYHAEFWARAVAGHPEARLAGVWDDNRPRGEAAAARHGTRYFDELGALLRECDAVGVTSETVRHADLVEEAARAGVHILCEKPMAASLADCDRIQRAVEASGVTFMQNFPKRFDPVNHELVARVHRGELGRVVLVRVRHGHGQGHQPEFLRLWYVDPDLAGGGTLLDEGVHAADFLLWLLGPPERVTAVVSHRALQLRTEDTAAAIFTFPDGGLAEVATSWIFVAAEQSVEIYGTEGTALLLGVDLASRAFTRPPHLKVFRRGDAAGRWESSPTATSFGDERFHQGGPRHFIDCLRRGRRPSLGVEEGRRAVEMILAAYRAAASGRSEPVIFGRRRP